MRDEPFYPITSLHKDDLRDLLQNHLTGELPEEIARRIDALSNDDMKHIASKLADAFFNCCYWEALKDIFLAYSSAEESQAKETSAVEPEWAPSQHQRGGAP